MMTTRHVITLTNRNVIADAIERAVVEDFATMQRRLVHVPGYGLCIEISVEADEYDAWIVQTPDDPAGSSG